MMDMLAFALKIVAIAEIGGCVKSGVSGGLSSRGSGSRSFIFLCSVVSVLDVLVVLFVSDTKDNPL